MQPGSIPPVQAATNGIRVAESRAHRFAIGKKLFFVARSARDELFSIPKFHKAPLVVVVLSHTGIYSETFFLLRVPFRKVAMVIENGHLLEPKLAYSFSAYIVLQQKVFFL